MDKQEEFILNIDESLQQDILQIMIDKFKNTEYTNAKEFNLKVSVADILKEKGIEMPRVFITPDAYAKMFALVDSCSKEIAWHGLVKNKKNDYVIYDILVYPQIIQAAYVESDDDAYPQWIADRTDDEINHMRMQGHSHVNMSVSPSGTDEGFFQTIYEQTPDFYIFIIANKKREVYVRLYDKRLNIGINRIPLEIILTKEATTINSWYDSHKDIIKEYKAPIVTSKNYNPPLYNNYYGLSKDTYDDDYFTNYQGPNAEYYKNINHTTAATKSKHLTRKSQLIVTLASGKTVQMTAKELSSMLIKDYGVSKQSAFNNINIFSAVSFYQTPGRKVWNVKWGNRITNDKNYHCIEWEVI